MATSIAFFALLVNAVLCAAFAERPDTFLITTAMLVAVLIMTLREDRHHG